MAPENYDPPDTGIPWLDAALFISVIVFVTGGVIIGIFHKFWYIPVRSMLKDANSERQMTRAKIEEVNEHAKAAAADAAVAKDEVKNTHTTNLRHDLDEIMVVLRTASEDIGRISATQKEHTKDIGGLREEGRLTRREVSAVNDRVSDVHDAQVAHEKLKAGMEPRLAEVEQKLRDLGNH
ncbi:hypothetical protein [uncultured Rothia sp.]|uniref:hypothetical protein n=1 Tax=uncultured Rothia sp. TaxID=316088 RepID=UPI0032175C8F